MVQTVTIPSKREQSKWKWLNIIDWLLPTYVVLSIPLFYYGLHVAFIFKAVGIFVTIAYIMRCSIPRTSLSKLFTAFVWLVFFSFIQYIYNERPIIGYLDDVSNYVAAMLFFYIGISDARPNRSFYNKMLYAISVVFALGLICYVLTPSWFISRHLELINNSAVAGTVYSEDNVMDKMRFSAFLDSYSVSHLSVFAAAIAIFSVAKSKGKEMLKAIVCFAIALLSSIASMHRASMIGCAITFIMFAYYNHRLKRYKINIYLSIIAIISVGLFILIFSNGGDRFDTILQMLTNRVDDNMSLTKALDERKFTQELLSSMQFFIFGHGLGAGGVTMRDYGFPGIADMQYVKMFFENGIVGAFLFIIIMTRALIKGVKYIDYYLTEVIIILFILVAMLGSNSLSIYYYIVYPFWYAVGRIFNNQYLTQLRNNNIIY